MPGWGYWLLFALAVYVWLAGILVLLRRDTGRARQRGGFIRPGALPGTRVVTTSTSGRIRLHAGCSSFSPPPGGVSAGWAIPRAHREPSRLTGRGWSIVGTEAVGASGQRRDSAAWTDWTW